MLVRQWQRYGLTIIGGLLVGAVGAVTQIRQPPAQIANGPWRTSSTNGAIDQSSLARAQVALFGLLALPRTEAMYFIARNDSEGRVLDGRCSYVVRGSTLDARWWSITLYQGEGWLVANSANKYSVGSAAVPIMESMPPQWMIQVGPDAPAGTQAYIPTSSVPSFDLTLRAYHPGGALLNDPAHAQLPTIERGKCA